METNNKAVQYFSAEYLKDCQKTSASEILRFLEDYRKLHMEPGELVQINIRVPKNILKAFKARAKQDGILYQLKIRELMTNWALSLE